MWSADQTELSQNILQFTISRNEQPATYTEVIQAWQEDAEFRSMFTSLLANVPFKAFRWETPPVSIDTMSRTFEFVVLNSPGLDRPASRDAFAGHFCGSNMGVSAFSNLGGDALLIIPCSYTQVVPYGHLAAFVRLAPEKQQHTLWQTVGEEMALRIGSEPVWLNTAGGGVPWLHVRLDSRPKYYTFAPYQEQRNRE